MDTPDLLDGIAFPFSVVLRPQTTGFQNLIITSGKPRGASNHQFTLPRGICTVQLEWNIGAAINMRSFTKSGQTSSDLRVLPEASGSGPRSDTFTIPVESDDAYMYFQQQWGGGPEEIMMVRIIPLPPDL